MLESTHNHCPQSSWRTTLICQLCRFRKCETIIILPMEKKRINRRQGKESLFLLFLISKAQFHALFACNIDFFLLHSILTNYNKWLYLRHLSTDYWLSDEYTITITRAPALNPLRSSYCWCSLTCAENQDGWLVHRLVHCTCQLSSGFCQPVESERKRDPEHYNEPDEKSWVVACFCISLTHWQVASWNIQLATCQIPRYFSSSCCWQLWHLSASFCLLMGISAVLGTFVFLFFLCGHLQFKVICTLLIFILPCMAKNDLSHFLRSSPALTSVISQWFSKVPW